MRKKFDVARLFSLASSSKSILYLAAFTSPPSFSIPDFDMKTTLIICGQALLLTLSLIKSLRWIAMRRRERLEYQCRSVTFLSEAFIPIVRELEAARIFKLRLEMISFHLWGSGVLSTGTAGSSLFRSDLNTSNQYSRVMQL